MFCVNDTGTAEISTLPYTTLFRSRCSCCVPTSSVPADRGQVPPSWSADRQQSHVVVGGVPDPPAAQHHQDRKSTRLNSSHANISYAVFCLKTIAARTPTLWCQIFI